MGGYLGTYLPAAGTRVLSRVPFTTPGLIHVRPGARIELYDGLRKRPQDNRGMSEGKIYIQYMGDPVVLSRDTRPFRRSNKARSRFACGFFPGFIK